MSRSYSSHDDARPLHGSRLGGRLKKASQRSARALSERLRLSGEHAAVREPGGAAAAAPPVPNDAAGRTDGRAARAR